MDQQEPKTPTLEERVREVEIRLDRHELVLEKLDRLVYKLFRRAKRVDVKPTDEVETA